MWSWLSRSRKPQQQQQESQDDWEARSDAERLLEFQRALGNRGLQKLLAEDAKTPAEVPFRTRMEAAFGEDFRTVRAHLGKANPLGQLNASAAAQGEDIAFDSSDPDPRVVAHELTHVVQARRFGTAAHGDRVVSDPFDPAEAEARTAAEHLVTGERIDINTAPSAPLSLQVIPPLAHGTSSEWPPVSNPPLPPTSIFEKPESSATPDGARKALEDYGKLSAGHRQDAFNYSFKTGSLKKVLAVLPPEDAAEAYQVQVRELLGWMEPLDEPQARALLRRVEEAETRKAAGKSDADLAADQSKFLKVPEKTSVAASNAYKPATKTRWEMLTPHEQAGWTARGNVAVSKFITYATAKDPKLGITAAQIVVDFDTIEKIASNALAVGGTVAAKRAAVVGFEFVKAVETDPAYAMPLVVHEIFGHPEFDEPGQANYQLALWRKATPLVPGYSMTAAEEHASIGYQESEIYSLLRQLPYWTPTAAGVKGVVNPDPKTLVEWHISEMEQEWDPDVLAALLHGLYKRFALDPHIAAMALAAFVEIIKRKFSKYMKEILG